MASQKQIRVNRIIDLSRYIAIHKRKQNPILTSFNHIKTSIIERLQHLRQTTEISPSQGGVPRRGERVHESSRLSDRTQKTPNKPISKTDKTLLTPYSLMPNANCHRPVPPKNKPISNPIDRDPDRPGRFSAPKTNYTHKILTL